MVCQREAETGAELRGPASVEETECTREGRPTAVLEVEVLEQATMVMMHLLQCSQVMVDRSWSTTGELERTTCLPEAGAVAVRVGVSRSVLAADTEDQVGEVGMVFPLHRLQAAMGCSLYDTFA